MEEAVSVRSAARFDIGDENANSEDGIGMEERENQKAGESPVVARESSPSVQIRVWIG